MKVMKDSPHRQIGKSKGRHTFARKNAVVIETLTFSLFSSNLISRWTPVLLDVTLEVCRNVVTHVTTDLQYRAGAKAAKLKRFRKIRWVAICWKSRPQREKYATHCSNPSCRLNCHDKTFLSENKTTSGPLRHEPINLHAF